MQIDRKTHISTSSTKKTNGWIQKNNQDKRKHLLMKPTQLNYSLNKHTQSVSTLHSNNISRNMTYKLRKQRKLCKNQLQKQIKRVTSELKIELLRIEKNTYLQQSKQNIWNSSISNMKKKTKSNSIKQLLHIIQAGYHKKHKNQSIQIKTIYNQSKTQPKLSLNMQRINKQNIQDYHDEFMSKIQQFSPSWRSKLQLQQKRMS